MKRLKLPLVFVISLCVALALFWFIRTSRAATETPEYHVIRTDGKFEIRDYPALTVVTTPMDGDEMNRSFGQLFRFITGSNEGAEKIEMTTPVVPMSRDCVKTLANGMINIVNSRNVLHYRH
jgi:hypothetical protein